MSRDSLIWAAVPHTGDGVVFQLRLSDGYQRFHLPRDLLEKVFGLEHGASDARQLELFYEYSKRIFSRASEKRSRGSSDTVRLHATDFISRGNDRSGSELHQAGRRAA